MDSYRSFCSSLVFLAVPLYCLALSSQAEHSELSAVYNVLSYGAVGDGKSNDARAFEAAWDAACKADDVLSAVFLVPKGYSFMIQSLIFTGPCRNRMFFRIEGRLVAPDGPDSWAEGVSKRYWVVFYMINGMIMEGGGVVDGKGTDWWNLPCKPHKGINGTTLPGPCDSPFAITFFSSSNLTVKNLTIKNSPQKHFWFESCNRVRIDSMHIKSPADSPNTDGIHLYKCNHVKIRNSVIATGDDCVSIGGDSYNVYIRNVTCETGHGISIGSLGLNNSRECVSNITVTNSTIKHSDNGVRIKTWQGGSGSVSSVTFRNIQMDMVRKPITINQYYCNSVYVCTNQTSAIYITDISYKDIKGTYDESEPPVYLACSDTVPCTNLTFYDVELKPVKEQTSVELKPFCWNAYGDAHYTTPPVDCLAGNFPNPLPSINTCW